MIVIAILTCNFILFNMRRASGVNRANLCHENFSFLTRGDFELPKNKFTTDID